MGLFHGKVCENLNKKNKTMYEIDQQEDTQTDALLIYAPKRAKISSLDSIYSEETNREAYKNRIETKWIIIGFAVLAAIVTTVVVVLIL